MTAADLRRKADQARAAADRATPGGLHGDPATLSGVQRRGGQKAMARRFTAYDREAAAVRAAVEEERREAHRGRAAAMAAADAKAHRDLDSLKPGDAVRDRNGWHSVVRVNAKSVSVPSGYSWVDRIPLERIIETRAS